VPALRRALRKNADHLRPWSPGPPPGQTASSLTEISRWIVQQRRAWQEGTAFTFLVTLTDDDDASRIVGRVALTQVVRGAFQSAVLGYWMDADHQRRGLMTESVAATLGFAFGPAGLHRVQAGVMPRNAASLKVLARLAFRLEGFADRYLKIAGHWEDHLLFGITAEEWKSRL
jgi:ribosomal-protein-alanine N-acetyltransferase